VPIAKTQFAVDVPCTRAFNSQETHLQRKYLFTKV
jgi:hypothetical protein